MITRDTLLAVDDGRRNVKHLMPEAVAGTAFRVLTFHPACGFVREGATCVYHDGATATITIVCESLRVTVDEQSYVLRHDGTYTKVVNLAAGDLLRRMGKSRRAADGTEEAPPPHCVTELVPGMAAGMYAVTPDRICVTYALAVGLFVAETAPPTPPSIDAPDEPVALPNGFQELDTPPEAPLEACPTSDLAPEMTAPRDL